MRFSPFKAGLLLIVGLLWLYLAGGQGVQEFFAILDQRVTDAMFRFRGVRPTSESVVIVDIDEKSLRALDQWPWPRTVLADLLQRIAADDPLVIGLDIVFAEPDRMSLSNLLPRLEKLTGQRFELPERELDNDLVMGEAMAKTPTITGYFFQMQDDGLIQADVTLCPEFSLPVGALDGAAFARSTVLQAYRPVMSIPPIADNALSEGFFNAEPDLDGTIRKAPLLIRFGDVLYPSLSMEMLREGLGETPRIATSESGIGGVFLGERFVLTDRALRMWINFRGPGKTFPYVSVIDVLEGVPEGTFAGKYVLLGTSTWGLRDLRATPFDSTCPGVELHANIIDNILAGDSLRHDELTQAGVTVTLLVAGGLLLSALLAFAPALIGGVTGLLLLVGIVIGNYHVFFLRQQLVGITFPLVALVAVFLVVTLVNFFMEGREKRFIRGAFSHYVSHKVVSELLRDPAKLTLEGEEKVLSVMFTDIRGFTSISEQLGAREMSSFLNEYLTAMTDIVMENQGTVDKFIGDAIMAIWGAPLDDEQHAVNAVRTTLRMIATLEELRRDWGARGLPPIFIGAGVNTGIMSVGNMGSRSRFDYTVIGDNVNLAARLEGLNKTYGTSVLITEYTRAAVGDAFFCRLVDLVRVKGKQQPVKLFEPLCEGAPDAARRAAAAQFEKALDAYHARRFAEALELVTALQARAPHTLHKLYAERCKGYLENPPADDWDGVFVFTHKGKDDE